MDTVTAVETALAGSSALAALRGIVRAQQGRSSGWANVAFPAALLACLAIAAGHETAAAVSAILLVVAAAVLNAESTASRNPVEVAADATLRRLRQMAVAAEWCPACSTWAVVDLPHGSDEESRTYLLAHSWRPSNTAGLRPGVCSRVHSSLPAAA